MVRPQTSCSPRSCPRIPTHPARRLAALSIGLTFCALGLASTPARTAPPQTNAPPAQAAQYRAETPKSIIDLQQFRRTASVPIEGGGTATLIDLDPAIGSWYVLRVERGESEEAAYHLENPEPKRQQVRLSETDARGVLLIRNGESVPCDLWSGAPTPLTAGRKTGLPYAPLCGGRLYLRNRVAGHRTELEKVTDFLRDHVWGGEQIIGAVKSEVFKDAFRETAEPRKSADRHTPMSPPGAPAPAAIAPAYADSSVAPEHLGIRLQNPTPGQMDLGRWYRASGLAGVYVSAIQPEAIAPAILASHPDRVHRLDAVEAGALDYLVAFDLSKFDVGFELGTDHPRVDWSERVPDAVRDDELPGPDGIGTPAPLVSTGMVPPEYAERTIATFTGGFKRSHGAFRYGALAQKNHGSHYGFVVEGVLFSKLQPGLATLYALADGTIGMKTWTDGDTKLLPQLRFARQNGVPIIAPDPQTGAPAPGGLVNRWGAGNWSGSTSGTLRTLRAGACLREDADRRYLVYGYFSTATPSAMARVFQAYGCHYAMLLDMNALEHTYLALYVRTRPGLAVEHVIEGMSVLDKDVNGQLVPRFLGYPDNRDFFYLMRRKNGE